jgi:hypothetical protein
MRREGEGRGGVACDAEGGDDIGMGIEGKSEQGRREEVRAMKTFVEFVDVCAQKG